MSSSLDILKTASKRRYEQAGGTSWTGAFTTGDYTKALQEIESTLNSTPDDAEGRLWWVRCQIETNTLPAMALTAPLEEIYEDLKAKPDSAELACETYALVTSLLLERSQTKIAYVMGERALEFANNASLLGNEERQLVADLYRKALEQEISRAESKLEDKDYIEGLKKNLNSISIVESKEKVVEEKPEEIPDTVSKKKVLTSKSIKEDILAAEEASDHEKNPNSLVDDRSHGRFVFLLLLLIIGPVAAFSWYYFESEKMRREEEAQALLAKVAEQKRNAEREKFKEAQKEAEEAPPEESKSQEHNQALEAVQSRLQSLNFESTPVPEPEPEPTVEEPAYVPPAIQQARGIIETVQEQHELPDELKQKSPAISPEALSQHTVTDLDRSQRAINSSRLNRGPDGKLYGPPPEKNYSGRETSPRTLDGKPLYAYEVEVFNHPQMYVTITNTNVLDAPSGLAPVIAKLEDNSKIEATSKMGPWLEIRSKAGRRGFIYAQDATLLKKK